MIMTSVISAESTGDAEAALAEVGTIAAGEETIETETGRQRIEGTAGRLRLREINRNKSKRYKSKRRSKIRNIRTK